VPKVVSGYCPPHQLLSNSRCFEFTASNVVGLKCSVRIWPDIGVLSGVNLLKMHRVHAKSFRNASEYGAVREMYHIMLAPSNLASRQAVFPASVTLVLIFDRKVTRSIIYFYPHLNVLREGI
jgi:hypothetical protein